MNPPNGIDPNARPTDRVSPIVCVETPHNDQDSMRSSAMELPPSGVAPPQESFYDDAERICSSTPLELIRQPDSIWHVSRALSPRKQRLDRIAAEKFGKALEQWIEEKEAASAIVDPQLRDLSMLLKKGFLPDASEIESRALFNQIQNDASLDAIMQAIASRVPKTDPIHQDALSSSLETYLKPSFSADPGQRNQVLAALSSNPETMRIVGALKVHTPFDIDGITLPSFISDGMVLQHDADIPLIGGCLKDGPVAISLLDQTIISKCINRRWEAHLPPLKPGGPWELSIEEGGSELVLTDVYAGDVWLAAGQSNMGEEIGFSGEGTETPLVRLFKNAYYTDPLHGVHRWKTFRESYIFSTIAGNFAKKISSYAQIPVGIIDSSHGSTSLACWQKDGRCFAEQIKSFLHFPIKGVIWWQGEVDTAAGSPADYAKNFARLIRDWRGQWGLGALPFLYVQLQRYSPLDWFKTRKEGWPHLREEQRQALSVDNTAMVVSFDLTDGDLHPRNKEPIASRLALAAEALVYGEPQEYSGPLYSDAFLEGESVMIRFSHAEGLVTCDGEPLRDVEVMDGDGVLHAVKADMTDNGLMISVRGIKKPRAVRYAYKDYPLGNLCNSAALPASPFVTGTLKSSDGTKRRGGVTR